MPLIFKNAVKHRDVFIEIKAGDRLGIGDNRPPIDSEFV